jgi:hypothetical protein
VAGCPYGLDTISQILKVRESPAKTLTMNPFIEDIDTRSYLRDILAAYEPDLVGISIRNIDNAIVAISEAEGMEP